MTLSYYEGARPPGTRLLFSLIALNGLFSAAVLTMWTAMQIFVADPITWATWAPLGRDSNPDFFDYPFVLLWSLPAGCAFAAWWTNKLGDRKLAYALVGIPVLWLGMVFAWYYLTPADWH
jgi:hypothetical protein